jgi:hypothetical protein
MRGTHPHAHLHLEPNGNERLEHGPVFPGHLVRREASFRCARESGRIRGRAGMGSMYGEHTKLRQKEHRSPSDENDDRVEGQQLSILSTISHPCGSLEGDIERPPGLRPCGGFVRLAITFRDTILWGAHGPPPTC